jgi:Holliday junction resolvasome RuvABC DNA-binding subunit
LGSKKKKTKEELVKDKIRKALIECGYPSAKVDEVMKTVEKIPDEMVDSFI